MVGSIIQLTKQAMEAEILPTANHHIKRILDNKKESIVSNRNSTVKLHEKHREKTILLLDILASLLYTVEKSFIFLNPSSFHKKN
jgi:hypothetical protein